MEKMKAITLTGVRTVEVREYEKPVPGKHEVLVKMKACALCTVDQRAYQGVTNNKFPSVQGHEGSGIVEMIGEDVHFIQAGDHVVLQREFCGVCHYCKEGINQCLGRARRRKEFAEKWEPGKLARPLNSFETQMAQYLVIQENMLTKISPELSFEEATLTEPISCVLHGINRSRLKMGEVVVVIGAGIMGLIHVQIAKLKGATVIVSEMDEARKKRAREAGADFIVDPSKEDPVSFVKKHSYGRDGADVVFDTVPISTVFEQALEMLARAGRVVAYSSQHPDVPVPLKVGELHSKEIEIIGTMGSNNEETYMATQLLGKGMIRTDLLIDYVFEMEDCKKAFEQAIIPGTYRVVIRLQ